MASTAFRSELFVAAPDPSIHGEGDEFLGSQLATTDSAGDTTFSFLADGLTVNQKLTATATNTATGDTSEFSANITVAAAE